MTGPTDFTKFVPGFDFLQGLIKNAGRSLPDMGQWIAPTLDPEELGKRIDQLKTVQYWLEQNAKMLATTIQALEVQRMTLSTLKNMDLPMERMREAFTIRPAPAGEAAGPTTAPPAPPPAPAPAPEPAAPDTSAEQPPPPEASRRQAAPQETPTSPVVDPMQWWNALTQQFSELAAHALKETSAGVSRNLGAQAPESPEKKAPTAAKPRKKAAPRAARKAPKA